MRYASLCLLLSLLVVVGVMCAQPADETTAGVDNSQPVVATDSGETAAPAPIDNVEAEEESFETAGGEETAMNEAAAAFSGYAAVPDVEDLPLPPEGWYAVDLGGTSVDVFRDGFGVPHVFAPTIEAAFRAQGYVIMEDRFLQALRNRAAARGLTALSNGEEGLRHDRELRLHFFTDDELDSMVAELRPDLRGCLEAYVAGVNDYMSRYAPDVPAWDLRDSAAYMVYLVSMFGDGGEEELQVFQILEALKMLKGEEFMQQIMHDALPRDVPNAPTTDHSAERQAAAASTALNHADYNPAVLLAALEHQQSAKDYAESIGMPTGWGSNAWVVTPERSASGKAMLFGGPMMGWGVPQIAVEVHLNAPGFNVIGMCFPGTPGVQIGHNDRIAWTTTSGGMNQTDYFVEVLNPDNPHQYQHNGEWKDMESHDMAIPVRRDDGSIDIEPFTQYRTLHGPVVQWDESNNKAYARASTHRGHEVSSFMGFIDYDKASTLEEFEAAVRSVASTHNFFAADVDGNIGYWLAGRFPVRHPDQDPRLPTPGTGEYDWQGVEVITDKVRSINAPEGWYANWNNKPSAETPGWFPEMFWGVSIITTLEGNDSITWDEFVAINKTNGEHNFLAHYFKPYLLEVVAAKGADNPRVTQVEQILADWPDQNIEGAAGALIFDSWMKNLLVALFEEDFAPLITPSLEGEGVRIFAPLAYRVLFPEKTEIELTGDYLRGRDKDEVAFDAFMAALDELTQEHGENTAAWPYEPGVIEFDGVGEASSRNVGTYCMAAELDTPIRSVNVLPPGQSMLPKSEHYADQVPVFAQWQYKEMKHLPEEFERP